MILSSALWGSLCFSGIRDYFSGLVTDIANRIKVDTVLGHECFILLQSFNQVSLV
jgi:hypothetical protein